jgi:hypothetical protein
MNIWYGLDSPTVGTGLHAMTLYKKGQLFLPVDNAFSFDFCFIIHSVNLKFGILDVWFIIYRFFNMYFLFF